MPFPDKLVFVDLETTGGRVSHDRIIEIGILRVEHGQLVDTYNTLVNPQAYLSPFIEQMTGIRKEDLYDAPTFDDIKDEVMQRISDCVFVAHNVRFDYGFLRNELKRFDISFTSKHFCTAKLSQYLYPQHRRHNLDILIDRFGFNCENRHRAFDDAKVLWEFCQVLQREFDSDTLQKAVDHCMKKPSIPSSVPQDVLDNLPESPGVYIFYGQDNIPLYVGKSVNIKERVLSHFTNDYDSTKEMSLCSQTTRIDHIVTGGELSALLKESALIKTMQPLYNRQLRAAYELILAKKHTNKSGYDEVSLELASEIPVDELDSIIGIFKSKRQAKTYLRTIAKQYGLCERYPGLEKTTNSCFAHKLGVCSGACIKKESAQQYNFRLLQAIQKQKIKNWPYSGPILVQEENVMDEIGEGFIIDKWCVLGNIRKDSQAFDLGKYSFDLDTYAILKRYLSAHQHTNRIKQINPAQLSQYMEYEYQTN